MSGVICEQEREATLSADFFLPLEERLKNKQKVKSRKIILIAGPTACGKTALSLLLASALKGEIITADSMQIYRGMDIGTAKVSEEDQKRIPHHLIDIREPHETFNVVDFYYEAKKCCESILARDRVPIIVGGSGFYFRSLLYGPPSGPPSIPEVRHSLEREMERLGSEALYEKIKAYDSKYAATITCNDKQKIIRALEIIVISGEKVSELSWQHNEVLSDYLYHPWFVYRPRRVLYSRIEARCDQMLEVGLVDEVRELEKKGIDLNPSASQAIGYRQCLDFLHSSQTEGDYKKFVRKFKTASRQYAKRQFTWFRKEPLFRWLNIETHDFEIAADVIMKDYTETT
ncbi:MAG: tRNA (adenosine(37)-N6)-dimethylallyltransferase MiaA [Chlamydiia bacterium]|nr:tRNA (adenosine(37)-N6)-dimethylallyltransferase MiaA [Chlamydiia bacterium]